MANTKLKKPVAEAQELDLKCFMNLMVVLIPMLLISAEFAKVAVIDIKLPEGRGSSPSIEQKENPDEKKEEKLLLTVFLTDSAMTLGTKAGFLPTTYYREFHRYRTADGSFDEEIEFIPGGPAPKRPGGARGNLPDTLKSDERYDIFLYATTDEDDKAARRIKECWYTEFDELLTGRGPRFDPVMKDTPINVGDTLFALTNPRRRVVVTADNLKKFRVRRLSAYDELKNTLMNIKARFSGEEVEVQPEDKDDIIVAAENEVIFDKIIQIMDVARASDFPNISIAKLRE